MNIGDELLKQAVERYTLGRIGYRDAMVATGRLLHQFVLARLTAANGVNEAARRAMGATRERAVIEAVNALKSTRLKVAELLRIAAVVELLGDNDPGAMSYSVLRMFTALVKRAGNAKYVSRSAKDNGVPPSEWERWILHPHYEQWSRSLFVKARDEKWPHDEVQSAINAKKMKSANLHRARSDVVEPVRHNTLSDVAANATPRDLADMILSMIEQSQSPETVAEIIKRQLSSAATKGKK